MKVAVIGSGVGGLTSAAYLAQKGHDVTVFEQFPTIGGVTSTIKNENGFQWDLGQLILEGLGPGEPLGQILSELGVADKLLVTKEDRGYVFPEFEINKPPDYEGIRWRIDLLKEIFPEDAGGLERYWRDFLRFSKVMTLARRLEQEKGLRALLSKMRLLFVSFRVLRRKGWSAQRLMDHYFRSEQLQLVFISIIADFFTPPSQFLGLAVFALNAEAVYDKRMPKRLARNTEQLYHYNVLGGIGKLPGALAERISECGGKLLASTPIVKIRVAGNRVTGVVDASGNEYEADVVVASGGARETFFKLVGEQHLPDTLIERICNLKLMDSIFMVHLGLDYDPTIHTHDYMVRYYYGIRTTSDLEAGVERGRAGHYHEGEEGFVVHVPTKHSPAMAPTGHHAMTIYTICPDQLVEGSWVDRKEEFADKLVALAEAHIPDLKAHTKVRVILTPEDFRRRTHLDHHAFGGLAPYLGVVPRDVVYT